jgi:hypothetical protein
MGIGAASGALGGKLTDVGINDDFMKDAASALKTRDRWIVSVGSENDDGQGPGGPQGGRRNGYAHVLRRDERGRPSRGAGWARSGRGGDREGHRQKHQGIAVGYADERCFRGLRRPSRGLCCC